MAYFLDLSWIISLNNSKMIFLIHEINKLVFHSIHKSKCISFHFQSAVLHRQNQLLP